MLLLWKKIKFLKGKSNHASTLLFSLRIPPTILINLPFNKHRCADISVSSTRFLLSRCTFRSSRNMTARFLSLLALEIRCCHSFLSRIERGASFNYVRAVTWNSWTRRPIFEPIFGIGSLKTLRKLAERFGKLGVDFRGLST